MLYNDRISFGDKVIIFTDRKILGRHNRKFIGAPIASLDYK